MSLALYITNTQFLDLARCFTAAPSVYVCIRVCVWVCVCVCMCVFVNMSLTCEDPNASSLLLEARGDCPCEKNKRPVRCGTNSWQAPKSETNSRCLLPRSGKSLLLIDIKMHVNRCSTNVRHLCSCLVYSFYSGCCPWSSYVGYPK
jgi:hypothetical protein